MKVKIFDDDIGSVEYVDHMGSDLTIVNAARVSFGVEKEELNEKDIKLINYLMQHNHTSPFEHCVVTMRFTVPLFIRSQHHRHRTWAYNEISRRYTSIDMKFYEPGKLRAQHDSNRQASKEEYVNKLLVWTDAFGTGHSGHPSEAISRHNKTSLSVYESLVASGVCREQARSVLPQGLYTEYYGTVNLHNLLKFISLRVHKGAQWEIQQVAKACLKIAKEHYPHSVEAYIKKHGVEYES
jgi:thymidylate synthase (FAD)